MSSRLYWKPANTVMTSLPDELKFILQGYCDTEGGSIRPTTFTHEHLDYLRGLRDAKVRGARELIDAIEMHGKVELKEEW